jgi:1-deoxy-D-xylulose-5-phosphate synthase
MAKSGLLSQVNHPRDLEALSLDELETLAEEIRRRIMEVVNVNGGHLASNLGSVELTLALHRVFDFPKDRLVWDVSHQTYPHKLITGRRDRFHELRTYNGICGFCSKRESIFDLFDAGHAGTAISLALGVAAADQLFDRNSKSVAVVGDAAIAAGMAFEALNHAGELNRNLLVVLNDNRMSIDVSVGALSQYLSKIRSKRVYHDLKKDVHDFLNKIPLVGKRMEEGLENLHESIRHSFVPGLLFQELGFSYYGPVDGHDLGGLLDLLADLRDIKKPVLLHLHTVKGHGYDPASENPIKYHALKNFLPEREKAADEKVTAPAPRTTEPLSRSTEPARPAPKPKPRPGYSAVFAEAIVDAARRDRRVAAITAAMPGGTGLTAFKEEFPERYFDVGIAEQHGGAFASGLAYGGLRPVFAVYSTFCQRAYDQFVHDTCIQENSVIFCLDRAGIAGEDGWTHHGMFDIAYMRCIPNVILMAPRDGEEFLRMFQFALDQTQKPVAIRYPKSQVPLLPTSRDPVLRLGRAEILRRGEGVVLHAYGAMVERAYEAAVVLDTQGVSVTVVNARFAKPLDVEMLRSLAKDHRALVTLEEHTLMGGFGSAVTEALADEQISFERIVRLGIPDAFQTFGPRDQLLKNHGLDVEGIVKKVRELIPHGGARMEPRTLKAATTLKS